MYDFWSKPTTKDAYRLSITSIIIEWFAVFIGLLLFMSTGSTLWLLFSFENAVDVLSSVFVLWRFYAPDSIDDTTEQNLQKREMKSSLGVSIVLVALGIIVMISAIYDFARGYYSAADILLVEEKEYQRFILFLSLLSTMIFTVLTVLKFKYAKQLQSESLYKDGICSLIGTVLSFTLFFSTIFITMNPHLWFIDPTISLSASIFAMYMGGTALYDANTKEKIPIFTMSWWLSNSDETTTTNNNNNNNINLQKQSSMETTATTKEKDEEDQENIV